MTQRVFVEANVFYSKTLMDWLFFLNQENSAMFQLHATENLHYDIICPDDFFVLVTKSAPPKMRYPINKEQIAYWSKNPKHQQLDEALRRANCTEFAEMVRSALQRMALMSEI